MDGNHGKDIGGTTLSFGVGCKVHTVITLLVGATTMEWCYQ